MTATMADSLAALNKRQMVAGKYVVQGKGESGSTWQSSSELNRWSSIPHWLTQPTWAETETTAPRASPRMPQETRRSKVTRGTRTSRRHQALFSRRALVAPLWQRGSKDQAAPRSLRSYEAGQTWRTGRMPPTAFAPDCRRDGGTSRRFGRHPPHTGNVRRLRMSSLEKAKKVSVRPQIE